MSARWPAGLHLPAGSQPARSRRSGRLITTPIEAYSNPVTVDLAADGIALLATFAGGTARAQVGPSGVGQTWALDQAFVSTSVGPLDGAQCALFVGALPIAPLQVASNLSGGGAQFGLGGIGLAPGEFVWAVWTLGTNGATASLRVTGLKTVLDQ